MALEGDRFQQPRRYLNCGTLDKPFGWCHFSLHSRIFRTFMHSLACPPLISKSGPNECPQPHIGHNCFRTTTTDTCLALAVAFIVEEEIVYRMQTYCWWWWWRFIQLLYYLLLVHNLFITAALWSRDGYCRRWLAYIHPRLVWGQLCGSCSRGRSGAQVRRESSGRN